MIPYKIEHLQEEKLCMNAYKIEITNESKVQKL